MTKTIPRNINFRFSHLRGESRNPKVLHFSSWRRRPKSRSRGKQHHVMMLVSTSAEGPHLCFQDTLRRLRFRRCLPAGAEYSPERRRTLVFMGLVWVPCSAVVSPSSVAPRPILLLAALRASTAPPSSVVAIPASTIPAGVKAPPIRDPATQEIGSCRPNASWERAFPPSIYP